MPAMASLEELQAVQTSLNELKENYPAAYAEVVNMFRKYRKIGYKNICNLMLGEATPESLKKE